MKEELAKYVKRVMELVEHARGNEQATKQSLIGPLFTLLGYDLTDPRECVPEYRADFGRERSVKPVDWAFFLSGKPIFLVEAKDAGKKLRGYDEQLADYFAKSPEAKLGILTNGVQWRFFTDVVNRNVMDKEPFASWDLTSDEQPPYDLLTLLQKAQFNSELIRAYAQRRRAQNLLVEELNRLLEPAPEFTRLAVANIETRKFTEAVLESWKPVLASAISEWAKHRTLSSVLEEPSADEDEQPTESGSHTVTTEQELEGFAVVKRVLGPDRPVAYEDTRQYFKIHLPNESFFGTVCRLVFRKRSLRVWLPLSVERTKTFAPTFDISAPIAGWSAISLDAVTDIERLSEVLRVSYDQQLANCAKSTDSSSISGSE